MDTAMRATVYLGANVPGKPTEYNSFRGSVVTDTDFSLFLDDYVTPRFPGFTVRETLGYWHGKPERSRELSILAPMVGDAGLEQFEEQVAGMAREYKRKFRQEAVMISYEPVMVEWDAPAGTVRPETVYPPSWVSRDGSETDARDEGSERFDVVKP